jgi:hypothetical protein
LEDAFTKKKGKPIKQHSTFPITYDDSELMRIQTALVDLVDPLISLPRTTGVRGDALHAHEAYRNENEYRFQQLFRRTSPRRP